MHYHYLLVRFFFVLAALLLKTIIRYIDVMFTLLHRGMVSSKMMGKVSILCEG